MRLVAWLLIGVSVIAGLAVGCAKWLRWARRKTYGAEAWDDEPS